MIADLATAQRCQEEFVWNAEACLHDCGDKSNKINLWSCLIGSNFQAGGTLTVIIYFSLLKSLEGEVIEQKSNLIFTLANCRFFHTLV